MKKVLVAMSGGVDSSVACAILKEQGYDLIGATIKTWSSDECRDEKAKGCCSIKDVTDARMVAGRLGIPYYVLDLSENFKEKVIDNFVETYLEGQTPNPCIHCNNSVKFGPFLDKAKELGCDYVATGHYARLVTHPTSGLLSVQEGADLTKDQSYVLFGLTQEQLKRTLFPVGEYSKKRIREMAVDLGLSVADKPDSMEICFVAKGEVVGKHKGYHHYTIGQRKRLHVTDKTPFYVLSIIPSKNQVVIGKKEELAKKTMKVLEMNWVIEPEEKEYSVKIRSRHSKSTARIVKWTPEEAEIEFIDPVDAISPGQAAVIYDKDIVIGGGWIIS